MNILLICDFSLINMCANSTRVISFAKILRDIGCNVSLLGVEYSKCVEFEGDYEGFPYLQVFAPNSTGVIGRFSRIKEVGDKLIASVVELHKNKPIDAVILSGFYWDFYKAIKKIKKFTKAKLIVNSVEWYKERIFSHVFGIVKLFQFQYAFRVIHKEWGNIIAISHLLTSYYKATGCNTVYMPTIVDLKQYPPVSLPEGKGNGEKLIIAYAGKPYKKDYILNVINAIHMMSEEEKKRVEFRIFGPTKEELLSLGLSKQLLDDLKNCLVCYGEIPHVTVKNELQKADFTVLLRPNMKYANAGFPTKVGESMAAGVPVITNLTSDLGLYIHDGVEGLICDNESPQSCLLAIRRAMCLSREEKNKMRKNAYLQAKKSFDYQNYLIDMKKFLERLKE